MDKYRKKIDKIDEHLVELLDQRMGLAFELGKIKKEKGLPVNVPEREQEIFDKLKALPKETIRDDELEELFERIIAIGRRHGKRATR
ncbi:MAG: chorismate mutase [Candidatus Marinimicrobia bacterium]|nr:chorismate mutase [Candidatus Neomarinimicrobiota bacterium]